MAARVPEPGGRALGGGGRGRRADSGQAAGGGGVAGDRWAGFGVEAAPSPSPNPCCAQRFVFWVFFPFNAHSHETGGVRVGSVTCGETGRVGTSSLCVWARVTLGARVCARSRVGVVLSQLPRSGELCPAWQQAKRPWSRRPPARHPLSLWPAVPGLTSPFGLVAYCAHHFLLVPRSQCPP